MVAAKDWNYTTQPEVVVVRIGVSLMNPKIHYYSKERGPRHRRCPKIGATIVCDQCAAKADER